MPRIILVLFVLVPLITVVGVARAADGMTIANQLGTMLAAEKPCHLEYDQAAIQRYIAKNVPEGDMQFISLLQMMVVGQEQQMQDMTPSTLTALCVQTARAAKVNGFIH